MLSLNPLPLQNAGVISALHPWRMVGLEGVFPAGRFSVEREWGSLCTNIFGILNAARKQMSWQSCKKPQPSKNCRSWNLRLRDWYLRCAYPTSELHTRLHLNVIFLAT